MNPADLRREYTTRGLLERDVDPDPFRQFGAWFKEALDGGVMEPNAMTLATVGADLKPSARVVLLKGFDSSGFVFFTNEESRKGLQMAQNPHVALCFAWLPLERQVCITGRAAKVGRDETEAYFRSRPLGSQLGAWASAQSRVVASRDALEAQLSNATARFKDVEVPPPPHWGGYRVTPDVVEFWQGRPNRLHDRIQYRAVGSGWVIERLSA